MRAIRPEILALEPSGIGKVAGEHLGDPEIVPLWFGESDLVTPDFIRRAAVAALEAGKTVYGPTRGHEPVREAIRAYLERLYGLRIHPDRISLPGSTMLTVLLTCQCIVAPGDEVILVSPYWPNIRTVIEVLGGVPVDVRLEEGPQRWWLDLDKLRAAIGPRTKAIYVNSPSNPTGWIMAADEQKALLELCRAHGLALIADEVYHRNVLDGPDPAPSFLALAEDEEPVFVLNGFSKAWAMTGWRLGWMVHPVRLSTPIRVLSEVTNTGATAFAQYGGIAALERGEAFVAAFRERTRVNRDLVMRILGSHPRVRLLRPEGAFYAFPRIEGLTDSLAFCLRLVREAKVGTAAGYSFGAGNESHIRLAFAIAPERLEPALERIRAVLDRL